MGSKSGSRWNFRLKATERGEAGSDILDSIALNSLLMSSDYFDVSRSTLQAYSSLLCAELIV